MNGIAAADQRRFIFGNGGINGWQKFFSRVIHQRAPAESTVFGCTHCRKAMVEPSLVWLRQDLRIADNPALAAAAGAGGPVIPLFILDDETPGRWRLGGAARWWLHGSLESLGRDLERLGAPLVLRRGPAEPVLRAVLAESGARAVFWNRCYEPFAVERDRRVKSALRSDGITVESFNAALLHEPWTVGRRGDRFTVYSQFARALRRLPPPEPPLPAPPRLDGPEPPLPGDRLADWRLRPGAPERAEGLQATGQPGEAGALARLERFMAAAIARYGTDRHRPDLDLTSRLSPHLRFGEIGPRQVWRAIEALAATREARAARSLGTFLRELHWREFAYHLLHHCPHLPERALDPAFDDLPTRNDPAQLRAWQEGRTGYPIVDAAMRQLRATGWMHNRLRMIVGSFLAKDLLLPWQEGAAWFWDNLVDADLANNTLGWQWVAGTGPDAVGFVRIANPVLQARSFDPGGAFVRRWLPELAALPGALIHEPWRASSTTLAGAAVRLGETYPLPIVDHLVARRRALAAYGAVAAIGS
jgi:deoxyribodipyrimidine photo-lyase